MTTLEKIEYGKLLLDAWKYMDEQENKEAAMIFNKKFVKVLKSIDKEFEKEVDNENK